MSDLTPEALAEWRKAAEDRAACDCHQHKHARRVIALIDALERAERERDDLRAAMWRLADEWGITAGGSADFAEQIRDDGAGTFAIEFMLTLLAEHPAPERDCNGGALGSSCECATASDCPATPEPPSDVTEDEIRQPVAVGDRVRLWIGPPKRGGWRHGEVIALDNHGSPGVEVRFDAPVYGQPTCYATHAEVQRVTPRAEQPTEDEVLDSIAACTNPVTRLPKWLQAPALGRDFRPIHAMVVEAIRERYHLVPKGPS